MSLKHFATFALHVIPEEQLPFIGTALCLVAYFFFHLPAALPAFNFGYFRDVEISSLLFSFIYGLRFDTTALVITNLPFILLHIFPFRFFYSKAYRKIVLVIFLTVNIPLLLLNCSDLILFRFSGKHATADVFKVMSFGEDFVNTLPKMILDFWYVLLIFFVLSYLLFKGYKMIRIEYSITKNPASSFFQKPAGKILSVVLVFTFTFVGFRGGIQYKPINILSASQYGSTKTATLVLNTPFTIIKTIGKNTLREVHYFSEKKASELSPFIKHSNSTASFRPMNVVVVILESFGKEYIGSLNNEKGYTPFLDSLISESLVFTNAYANGKRSIEGIPAILAGIPSLMTEPYITSAYSGNSLTSIASVLKDKGYASSFFHGGTNGTMNFDNFSHVAGFDRYFGRKEYNNDKDFDGSWGIFDEPFLQRVASELNAEKQPFLSAVFTLSSHHPYTIPDVYKNKFPEGAIPIHQSIQYADYALKRFFETAEKMPWYANTLFVITADHTALSENPFYQSRVGMYSIPVLFYRPDHSLSGQNMQTTQQIDILPSVLDYLHYDHSYFSFGSSVFDTTSFSCAVNYLNDNYQMIHGDYSLVMDTLVKNSLYHFTNDSTLQFDLSDEKKEQVKLMEDRLKAFIQNYSHALLHNKMTVSEY